MEADDAFIERVVKRTNAIKLGHLMADTKNKELEEKTHKMMLNHYRQTKNMLISYDKNKL